MAKYNPEVKLLEFDSVDPAARLSELQSQLPDVPISVYKLSGILFKARCLDYKFECLATVLPYCVPLYVQFQDILWSDPSSRSVVKDFATAREFFSKLSTSGFETQIVSRAGREKLQVVQFASQALSDYPLRLDDVKLIISSKSERSKLSAELDKLMHSSAWQDYSVRQQRKLVSDILSRKEAATPMVFKILLLNARHLSNHDRVDFLFDSSVPYKDALKGVVKKMRVRELQLYYSDPAGYRLPLEIS